MWVNKQIMEALDEALRDWDIYLYNEIKQENWILDLVDYEVEKREAYMDTLWFPEE